MKINTTYPTKHPNWIDEDDYTTPKKRRIGISFATATAIVIAIHVALVAGIYAYSSAKPRKAPLLGAAIQKKLGPKSDALDGNTWPKAETGPKVVATAPPPQPIVKAAAPSTHATTQKLMTKKEPTRAKPKSEVSSKKTSPPPREAANPATTAEQKELRRQFLVAAGKTSGSHPKPSAANKPQNSAAALEPAISHMPVAAPNQDMPKPIATAPIKPVSPARSKSAEASPARSAVTHYTLAPGDNLYMVSRKLGVSYSELAKANGIRDPRQLRVGQMLKVPGASAM